MKLKIVPLLPMCGVGTGATPDCKLWFDSGWTAQRDILRDMGKTYRCPLCTNEVDSAATICSNPACRAELAFCSHCRDITTYVLVEERKERTSRNLYRCDRCQKLCVKCYTWLSGSYCNGLAAAGRLADSPLCAGCASRFAEVTRNVIGWTLIGALGGLLKRKGG